MCVLQLWVQGRGGSEPENLFTVQTSLQKVTDSLGALKYATFLLSSSARSALKENADILDLRLFIYLFHIYCTLPLDSKTH